MKRLLGIAACACLLASCELLLAPKQQRDNPNDPNNPVVPMQSFDAVSTAISEIRLTIQFPEVQESIAGFIVVRREWIPPESPFDTGDDIVTIAFPISDTEYTDTGVKAGVEYWYSLWTFGSGDFDEHYTFSGTDSAWTLDPADELGSFSSFNAFPNSSQEIFLEWSFSDNTSGAAPPPNFLLVRKTGSTEPKSPTDGDQIFVKDDLEYYDHEVAIDTEYSYTIWPADSDGTPYPADVLAPNQTAWDSAETTAIQLLDIFISTSMVSLDEDSTWIDRPGSLQINSKASPQSLALLRFDLNWDTIRYAGSLSSASLFMKSQSITTPGPVQIFRIVQQWDSGTPLDWDFVSGPIFSYDDGLAIVTQITDTGTEYGWNVLPLLELQTQGFLVTAEEGSALDVTFRSSGGDVPWIEVNFYGEL
ncbi:MAG: hypothetical protein HN368_16125 [Spirochaetales bacterium]|nr:hypothetical protein [Spirochaetales bacterium]